jgi:cardiolipin synthase A/B
MNSRSIRHDLEIDYELQNQESIKLLKNQFLNDLKQSSLINLKDIQKRNPIIKLLGHLILYLRYCL